MDQGCSLSLTIQPGDRPWPSGGGQGPRNRRASLPGPMPSPASAAALPGGLPQSSHLLCDTLLPSQQVASPPTGSKSPDGPAGPPTSVPPAPALSSVPRGLLSGGCMRAVNPAPLSIGSYFAPPAEQVRVPWSQPPVQAAGLFMTVLAHMGSWLRRTTPVHTGDQHWVSRLALQS